MIKNVMTNEQIKEWCLHHYCNSCEYNKNGKCEIKSTDILLETIENDAYLHRCRCPKCNKKIHRGYEERAFYCENCGIHLHQRAFIKEEIDDALFQHEMDTYEDL